MTFARVVVLCALAASLSGCLGAATGPAVPGDDLAEHGWSASGAPSKSTKYGLVEIASQRYGPGGTSTVGGLMVVSVTDVPVLDEARFLPGQIEAYEKAEGLDLRLVGAETLAMRNQGGREVRAEVYDVLGAPAPAKAVVAHFSCGAPDVFVAVVAYGALPASGGLLRSAGADVYGQAKDLAAAVACGP